MVQADDAGIEGAEVGAERLAVDDRLDVVVAVAGHVGADDGELVGQLGQARKGRAEGDAGQGAWRSRRSRCGFPPARVILGSKVSNWLGPPCRKRKMTDLSASEVPAAAALAFAPRSWDSDRPPKPRVPMRRKSRRLARDDESKRDSMAVLPIFRAFDSANVKSIARSAWDRQQAHGPAAEIRERHGRIDAHHMVERRQHILRRERPPAMRSARGPVSPTACPMRSPPPAKRAKLACAQ